MRILVVTPHFFPETFKCNDLAFELQKRGHDVTVMTAIPDYPKGKFFDGYGVFKKRKETINGVKVMRTLIIPRGNGSKIRLIANYLSYTFFASARALWHGIRKKYDAIIVHETSPILVGIPAVIVKKIQKIPLHFWILDIWPESLQAAGGISNKKILSVFSRLTSWIYKNSTTLLISSKGFSKSIAERGDFNDKVKYFPNWVDNIWDEKHLPQNLKLPEFDKNRFNVVFAGNIGEAQDMEHLLEAAEQLRSSDIDIIIVGDGRKREWLEKTIAEKKLNNVKYFGRFPIQAMPSIYEKASVLYLSLKKEPIFSLTVPAKLQSYMASGKPIVAMMDGEGPDLIEKADCGWSVPSENSKALAELLRKIAGEDETVLRKKGENGRLFSQKHFDFATCIDNLEEYIKR